MISITHELLALCLAFAFIIGTFFGAEVSAWIKRKLNQWGEPVPMRALPAAVRHALRDRDDSLPLTTRVGARTKDGTYLGFSQLPPEYDEVIADSHQEDDWVPPL